MNLARVYNQDESERCYLKITLGYTRRKDHWHTCKAICTWFTRRDARTREISNETYDIGDRQSPKFVLLRTKTN